MMNKILEEILGKKSDDEKNKVISLMEQLVSMEAWEIILKIIDKEIEQLDWELKNVSFKDVLEVRNTQNKHNIMLEVKDLPKIISTFLKTKENKEEEDYDPY